MTSNHVGDALLCIHACVEMHLLMILRQPLSKLSYSSLSNLVLCFERKILLSMAFPSHAYRPPALRSRETLFPEQNSQEGQIRGFCSRAGQRRLPSRHGHLCNPLFRTKDLSRLSLVQFLNCILRNLAYWENPFQGWSPLGLHVRAFRKEKEVRDNHLVLPWRC